MGVRITFFQTSVNVAILISSHESWIFLMASRLVNPFQKLFSWLWPDPPGESLFMAATALQNIFVKISPESQNDSLIHRLKNESCVIKHENNINLAAHLHQSSWVTMCIDNEQKYFRRNISFWAVGLNSRLKICNKHFVNRHAVIQALLFHL